MGHALLCFTCCIAEQPQPKRRPRIDRSMIGLPTDFRHTGHIGSRDVSCGEPRTLESVENQMSSKGGYEHVSPVDIQLDVIDLPVKLNGTT